jgi:hypothetical protein
MPSPSLAGMNYALADCALDIELLEVRLPATI